MNFLRIWITLPDGETSELGELAFDEPRPNGTAPTAFRYASSWLARKDSFPINPDPQMLPLVAAEFQASHLGPPLQALNDALPDDWGRRLIVAAHRLPRHQQSPYWIMRAVAGNGLGALSFSEKAAPPVRTRSSRALADLAAAAAAFDAHQPIEDDELKRLYAAGATPGGELLDIGRHWLRDRAQAKRIVEEVIDTVERFRGTAEDLGVTPASVEFFAADIEQRIRKMRAGL